MNPRTKKIIIGAAVATLAIAVIAVNLFLQRRKGVEVQVETIERRDLTAVVSASGKIQPKRLVNISADTIGKVTRLAVEEGEPVEAGQFLLQIDPELYASAVQSGQAGIQAAREAVKQAKVNVEAARANLELTQQNAKRKRELFEDELVPREVLDQAESELRVRESELQSREAQVLAQEQRLQQEIANLRSARYNLSKVTIEAPMDGLVSRLNIEEGETVLVGTMNNPGTVLMTIADMSVIQAEIEVDETDIVDVRLGQSAKVAIDALPDEEFDGQVTKIGSSALQAAAVGGAQQATNFEVEVTLEVEVPGARPGFSCTADITTATMDDSISVPIQALTVREVTLDNQGQVVREENDKKKKRRRRESKDSDELPPGHERKEVEGVFVVVNDEVEFRPIEVGIAGEKYFQVLSGLDEGDQVVTGPFSSVRELRDGTPVKVEESESSGK
jgi:HlyD family secretion protein